jgi:hypothetical protein
MDAGVLRVRLIETDACVLRFEGETKYPPSA